MSALDRSLGLSRLVAYTEVRAREKWRLTPFTGALNIRAWRHLVLCASVLFFSGCENRIKFSEEVQISSGKVVTIEREVVTAAFGEVGGPGGWDAKFMSMELVDPRKPIIPPKWESPSGLVPIIFDWDIDSSEWYLVATFFSCQSWVNHGKPKPPYAEFRVVNGAWSRQELSKKVIGRKANLLTGIRSGGEPKRVSLGEKTTRMADPRIAKAFREVASDGAWGC